MLDGNLETAAVRGAPRFPQYPLVPSQQGLRGLAEGLLPAHLPRLHSNRLLTEHRIINHPQLEEQEPARDYLGVLLGTVRQEGPHVALQSLHVHLLGRLCVVDLNFLNLQKEQVSPQKQEAGLGLAGALGGPGEVQGPARPPRRWTRPQDPATVAVSSGLQAAPRPTQETLQPPRRCLHPGQEEHQSCPPTGRPPAETSLGADLEAGAEVRRVVSVIVVVVSDSFAQLSRQPPLALRTQLEETETKVPVRDRSEPARTTPGPGSPSWRA